MEQLAGQWGRHSSVEGPARRSARNSFRVTDRLPCTTCEGGLGSIHVEELPIWIRPRSHPAGREVRTGYSRALDMVDFYVLLLASMEFAKPKHDPQGRLEFPSD